jgi:GNAT superfamily N-acetyltransferase
MSLYQSISNDVRTESAKVAITLRNLKPKDCPILERLLSRVTIFEKDDEILAMELICHAMDHPGQKDYSFLIAANEDDSPVGYACFGPTPLTQGTFDLYWIAVDPAFTGQGIGTMLLSAIEAEVRKWKGRMMIIDTSSSPSYAQTRQFYLKNHYILAATIPDYFRDGEGRVTFIKKF